MQWSVRVIPPQGNTWVGETSPVPARERIPNAQPWDLPCRIKKLAEPSYLTRKTLHTAAFTSNVLHRLNQGVKRGWRPNSSRVWGDSFSHCTSATVIPPHSQCSYTRLPDLTCLMMQHAVPPKWWWITSCYLIWSSTIIYQVAYDQSCVQNAVKDILRDCSEHSLLLPSLELNSKTASSQAFWSPYC